MGIKTYTPKERVSTPPSKPELQHVINFWETDGKFDFDLYLKLVNKKSTMIKHKSF